MLEERKNLSHEVVFVTVRLKCCSSPNGFVNSCSRRHDRRFVRVIVNSCSRRHDLCRVADGHIQKS